MGYEDPMKGMRQVTRRIGRRNCSQVLGLREQLRVRHSGGDIEQNGKDWSRSYRNRGPWKYWALMGLTMGWIQFYAKPNFIADRREELRMEVEIARAKGEIPVGEVPADNVW